MFSFCRISCDCVVNGKVSIHYKLKTKDTVTIIYKLKEFKKETVFLFSLSEIKPVIDIFKCKKCYYQNYLFYSHLEEVLRDVLYENNLSLTFVHV